MNYVCRKTFVMPQQFVVIVLCLAMIACTFQVCKVHGAAVHGNVKNRKTGQYVC